MAFRLIITVDLKVETKEQAQLAAHRIKDGVWDAIPEYRAPEVNVVLFEDDKLQDL
jgi:hypothetical protein